METFNENELAVSEEDLKNNNKPSESVPFSSSIPSETPDDVLVEKIIIQVEYLFSDANILKDKFLLKHIRRNKEGYVSLKLISSLRKVKSLSKDWRVVANSLRMSKKLQLNEKMTKIRRLEPLPSVLETVEPSRDSRDCAVLLFHNIPGYWTRENVKVLLSEFRTVRSVAKINSKTDEMDPNVKRTLDFYGDAATFPFAIVKFDAPCEAANAVLRTAYSTSLIKIVPLVHGSHGTENKPVSSSTFKPSSIESSKGKEHCVNGDSKVLSSDSRRLDGHSIGNEDYKYHKGRKLMHVQKELLNALESKEKAYLPCTFRGDGPANNQWNRKKFFNGYLTGPSVIILRQPKGPDGTRGFRTIRITASHSLNR